MTHDKLRWLEHLQTRSNLRKTVSLFLSLSLSRLRQKQDVTTKQRDFFLLGFFSYDEIEWENFKSHYGTVHIPLTNNSKNSVISMENRETLNIQWMYGMRDRGKKNTNSTCIELCKNTCIYHRRECFFPRYKLKWLSLNNNNDDTKKKLNRYGLWFYEWSQRCHSNIN